MNSSSLSTASSYLNNLLLSRGLLRDGQTLDFAHPSHGAGGKETTLARIITLVHDLILRRDKESDTLSHLSTALSRTRADFEQKDDIIARLTARQNELERALALSRSTEERLREVAKKSQSQIKTLKEENVRLKNAVSQVRAQCVGDVRKREAEIRKLQKHLEGKRGGGKEVGVTVVQPGGYLGSLNGGGAIGGVVYGGSISGGSGGLQAETNAYLTSLSQELESENAEMKNLLQGTVTTLRHLQSLPSPTSAQQQQGDLSTIREDADPEATTLTTNTSFDAHVSLAPQPESLPHLSSSLNITLSSLRQLLTSPSFVSVEEVELRDEEIAHLRAGWDKMEARWREALGLMNEWRKRMVEKGDTLNLEDLSKGLVLGEGKIEIPPPDSVVRGKRKSNVVGDESFVSDVSANGEVQDEEGMATPTAARQVKVTAAVEKERKSPKLGFGLLPAPQILRATSGNLSCVNGVLEKGRVATVKANSPRARALMDTLISSDDVDELALLDTAPSPTKRRRLSQETPKKEDEAEDAFLDLLPTPAPQPRNSAPYPDLSRALDEEPVVNSRGIQNEAEIDIAKEEEEEEDSEPDSLPLTIEQKLALAQREAEAAKSALRAAIADSPTDEGSSYNNKRNNKSKDSDNQHTFPAPSQKGNISSSPRKSAPTSAAGITNPTASLRRTASVKKNIPTPKAVDREAGEEKENTDPANPATGSKLAGGTGTGKKGEIKTKKRTRAPIEARMELKKGMRRSKRRSTLSPAELEGLVGL